jgi:hypothetical protein
VLQVIHTVDVDGKRANSIRPRPSRLPLKRHHGDNVGSLLQRDRSRQAGNVHQGGAGRRGGTVNLNEPIGEYPCHTGSSRIACVASIPCVSGVTCRGS